MAGMRSADRWTCRSDITRIVDGFSLAEAGIGYIVLHKKFLEPKRLDELTTHLNEQAGSAIYDDEDIIAYKLPDVAEIAPLPVPTD